MSVAWPVVMIGVPIAVLLWHLTSRSGTDLLPDGIPVALVALACTGIAATRPAPQVAVLVPLAVAGGAAACVDAREGRLPDALTFAMLPATLCGVVLGEGDLVAALLAAALGAAVAVVLKFAHGAGIGWGDVKLVPTVGAALSQGGSILTFGCCVALLVLLTALLVGLPGRHAGADVVPYGPALVAGALFAAGPGG